MFAHHTSQSGPSREETVKALAPSPTFPSNAHALCVERTLGFVQTFINLGPYTHWIPLDSH